MTLWACASAPRPAPAKDAVALLRQGGVEPQALACNRDNRWGQTLRPDSIEGAADIAALLPAPLSSDEALRKKLQGLVFWRMVRAVLIEGDNNNFGVIALRDRSYVDKDGVRRPVLLFRTGLTPAPDQPGSCFHSLLRAGGVRHVVNIFDGEIPVKDLVEAEARAAAAAGASYHTATDEAQGGYGPWRDALRKRYDDPSERAKASAAVARLIREQILLPGGQPPTGNLHVHCGGGMHRTGMIVGIIERCVNRTPQEEVEAHYRYHVGYRDPQHPGGQEEGNLKFLRDFDCSLLQGAQ